MGEKFIWDTSIRGKILKCNFIFQEETKKRKITDNEIGNLNINVIIVVQKLIRLKLMNNKYCTN